MRVMTILSYYMSHSASISHPYYTPHKLISNTCCVAPRQLYWGGRGLTDEVVKVMRVRQKRYIVAFYRSWSGYQVYHVTPASCDVTGALPHRTDFVPPQMS